MDFFFFPCVRGLCDLVAGVQRAGGEKEHFELIPAAITTPIITTALNANANTDEVRGSCRSKYTQCLKETGSLISDWTWVVLAFFQY